MITIEETGSTHTATSTASVSGATATRPLQVWLVDDDDRLRSIVAEWLKRFEDIECTRDFNSPNAVLSALASKPGPDVILLDVQMGELSGLDAVRPIRSLSRSTRVVMFTSSYDSRRHQRAMADGASDFLLKYKPLEDVVARIREVASEPAPVVKRRRSSQARGATTSENDGAGLPRWHSCRAGGTAADVAGARSAGKGLWNHCLKLLRGSGS